MTRYLILGMGAAGIAAAESIRQHDPQGEIICVSAEQAGYYSRPGLAYYLSKELGRKSLYPFSQKDFEERQFKIFHNTVKEIDPDKHEVIFRDKKRLHYDRLLLALGAEAVRPKVEGIDPDSVVYLDSMAETQRMVKLARRTRQAVVVGGGITALEIVEGLQARNVKVHFFLRGKRYWSRVLDPIESQLILTRLQHEGVQVHLNTELDQVIEKRGKVHTILTKDGRKIKAGMLAFAIGVRPRIQLAATSGLDVNRGVKINPFMQTSAEDVYAAGDVAEIYDPETDSWLVDSLWSVARQQGIVAGMNLAGVPQAYRHSSPLNVTRLAGLTTTIIGQVGSGSEENDDLAIVRGESETWQQMPDAVVCQNNFDVNRLRVMVGQTTLLGAVLIGDQSLSRALEELVANEVNISPIRSQLLEPGTNPGNTILEFWAVWRKNYAN